MKEHIPCKKWAEKLAALHRDDLSPSDLIALDQHLSSCSTCMAVRREYLAMSGELAQDVKLDPPTGVPLKLIQRMGRLERWEEMSRTLASEGLPVVNEDEDQQKNWREDFEAIDYDKIFDSTRWLSLFHKHQQISGDNAQHSS